jgi:hypothetical protein
VRAALVALLVAGCVSRPIWVDPVKVEAVSAEPRAGQSATVEAWGGTRVTLRPDQVVDLEDYNGRVVSLRLDAIVRDCPLDDSRRHLCSAGEVNHVIVGHERAMSANGKAAVSGSVLVVGLVGLGYCWSECGDPWDTVSAVSLLSVGTVVVLSAVAAWGLSWGR